MFDIEVWIILAAICFLGEIVTAGFFLMSIGIGASTAAILNYTGFDPITQLVAFIIITLICLIISRPFANRLTKSSPTKKAAADRLIGKEGFVTEDIDPKHTGMVQVSGETWRAIANEKIFTGDKIIIKSIEGVRLVVEKKQL